MQRTFCLYAIACTLALPASAQTQRWSEAPPTQRWSEAPPAQRRPEVPARPDATQQWAEPTYTQRRSDADIQRQVDAISQDAARRAAKGRGGVAGRAQPSTPDQAWRDHMDRSRAQDQFQRDQDAYDQRQRDFNRRY